MLTSHVAVRRASSKVDRWGDQGLPEGEALGAALGLSMVVDCEENMLGAAAALPVLPPAVEDITLVSTQSVGLRFGG